MILEPYDEQLALDYTIYMMMGSFFDEAQPASVWKEKILKLRYQLLPQKAQHTLTAEPRKGASSDAPFLSVDERRYAT